MKDKTITQISWENYKSNSRKIAKIIEKNINKIIRKKYKSVKFELKNK